MSTPNRPIRENAGKYMANEFHIKEYTNNELLALYEEHNFRVIENVGILKVVDGLIYHNVTNFKPEEGYVLWFVACRR